MNIRDRFHRWFKLRFAIVYPFGIFVLIYANCDDRSLLSGIGFILAGLLIRIWANGYAIKLDKLTTSGPYSFVRHPLYLGTMFIVAGFMIMLKLYYIGVLFMALMITVYARTVQKEEIMLEQKFREAFLRYRRKVPAFWPAILPYREGEKWPYSFKRFLRSQEYKLTIWIMIIVIFFHVKEKITIRHEEIDATILWFIAAALFLAAIDITSEIFKWKRIT